jgi:hypothetical protein
LKTHEVRNLPKGLDGSVGRELVSTSWNIDVNHFEGDAKLCGDHCDPLGTSGNKVAVDSDSHRGK